MKDQYRGPEFSQPPFTGAPDARFEAAPADGVLPDGFFATTNLPTYVRVDGEWRVPRFPRMDGAIVREEDGTLRVTEGRYVRAGQPVAVGLSEDGSEGIFVHVSAFVAAPGSGAAEFQFMRSEVSREKPVDYPEMARLLRAQRAAGGHIAWVLGPAVLHSRGRDVLVWFIENGYVGVLLGGNAIGVHDIEQALMSTTLGMDRSGRPVAGGHSFHMRAINRIALAGSIRDDGPLPDTITDTVRAQELMREHAKRATMAIMIATALHSIAFGNMLPSFYVDADGAMRPLTTIAVDSSEFVVSKLKDRGTHQAFGVITNAQDFLHVLRHFVEQQDLAERAGAGPDTATPAHV